MKQVTLTSEIDCAAPRHFQAQPIPGETTIGDEGQYGVMNCVRSRRNVARSNPAFVLVVSTEVP